MFGIGMGPSSQEKQQYNALNSSAGFATGLGESNLTASSSFLQSLLSGDPTKIATALAPQISTGQQQGQQAKKTNAEFGNRSGGTAASNASIDANARGNIINLAGGLQSGAAGELSSVGNSLLTEGMSGDEALFGEAKTMQDQTAAKWNDIMNSINKSAQTAAIIA